MIFKDYYKILGLETNRVSMEDIKLAYRNAAKKYHPDLNVGDQLAEEKIKDINEAYKILSVPNSKRRYDRRWNSYIGSRSNIFNKKGSSKEILKNMFFGNEQVEKVNKPKGKAVKGENIETSITLNIYEAFLGVDKKLSLKNTEGKMRSFLVSIPNGIKQGEKIRLIGQGKEGKNGGKPGDLFIKINIKNDKRFKLKGSNVYTTLEINPWEAALGRRISVRTIDNEESKVYIPQGTQSGDTITIPGKGYKKNEKERGNLIAEIKITVPKTLTSEEKKLFEELDKVSSFNPRRN